jgi:protein TonB
VATPATPVAKPPAPASTKPAESPPAPASTKPAAPARARPAAPAASRATGTSGSARPLDSSALLGQIAVIETENQRQANADARVRRANPRDTGSLEGFYAAAWVRKVENIGEMNFPEVARRLNLSTGPVLDVAIRADGTVQEIRVLRSSGNAELDQAAQRIVRLGAPYAPFPPALRQQYDLLRISRSWRFDPDGRLSGR